MAEHLFVWVETTAFATWLRESATIWAYPTVLTLHTLGLAVLVGASAALDIRLLGFGTAIPLPALAKSFRVMWIGFWLNAVTGAILIPGQAVIRLTDPVFYIKLAIIALAIVNVRATHREAFRGGSDSRQPSAKAKVLAGTSLGLWTAAILTGRLLGYDYAPFMRWAALRLFVIAAVAIAIIWAGGFIAARTFGWTKPVRQRG